MHGAGMLFFDFFYFTVFFFFFFLFASCYASMLHYHFVVLLPLLCSSEAYSKPCQTSEVLRFECAYVIVVKIAQ